MKENDVTRVWQLYQKGVDQHGKTGINDNTARAYRFYEGDQWHGLDGAGEALPFYNFIKPIVNYRTSMVSMNNMQIVFNSWGEAGESMCRELNSMAAKQWEYMKMDKRCWELVKDGCIAGDSYIYFGGELPQIIDNTDIYLSDEQSADLQQQQWIIIRERRFVEDVRQEARKNGIPEDRAADIMPDDDTDQLVGDEAALEVDNEAKCTCLLMLRKKDGFVTVLRSARTVIYQPETEISVADEYGAREGMTLYPIASFVWGRKKGSSRGTGEVGPLIPNQIETNRTLVRRSVAVKLCAFGKPVYNSGFVSNPEALSRAGAAIEVQDFGAGDVRQAVSYLSPVDMSDDAHILNSELITTTRELAGAGDAALGQIDVEKTSGAAIIAARDQSAIPLNEQTAAFKQTVEDIALIWLDMWAAYNPGGITTDSGVIYPQDMRSAADAIRVDVTPTDAYSRCAAQQSLENALAGGNITFAEYVDALPEGTSVPKSRFLEIIRKREQMQQAQQMQQMMAAQTAPGTIGGEGNALSQMQM